MNDAAQLAPAPRSSQQRRRSAGTWLTALAPTVWGSTYLVTTELLPADRPLLAATVRALPAGVILVAYGRALPHGSWVWKALVLGLLNIGGFFVLLFVAAYRLPGGVAALVGSVQPLIVILLAGLLLGERATRRHRVASAIGVAGVGLLVLRPEASLDPVGVAAALGGAVSMAAGIVLTKRWGRPEGVGLLSFTGWQLLTGGAALLPVTLVFEGLPATIDRANLAGFLYLALVGSVFGYSVWFAGIQRLPATTVSFLGFLSPLVATALGFIVLGQSLSVPQLLGAVLVVLAIVVVQRTSTRSQP